MRNPVLITALAILLLVMGMAAMSHNNATGLNQDLNSRITFKNIVQSLLLLLIKRHSAICHFQRAS